MLLNFSVPLVTGKVYDTQLVLDIYHIFILYNVFVCDCILSYDILIIKVSSFLNMSGGCNFQ